MKIKIKNPVYGVPITVVDKIADDGKIHCEHNNDKINFSIVWTTDRGGDGKLSWISNDSCKRTDAPVLNGEGVYKRIFIHQTNGLTTGAKNNKLVGGGNTYARIFMRSVE